MEKIKIAFIKFGGLAAGGTERFLQNIAVNLPKERFEVDYYYTNVAAYIGTDYKHAPNDLGRKKFLVDGGINLIPVKVHRKDITKYNHEWVGTNFFELFDEKKYDFVQAARAGHPEYPFTELLNIPIVELITLPGQCDNQANIVKSIHISEWQANSWVQAGGNSQKIEIAPIITDMPDKAGIDSLRKKLNIPEDSFVFGMHQRADDGIFSPVALQAYKKIQTKNTCFVILGGSEQYSWAAEALELMNFKQLPHTSNEGGDNYRNQFLASLDVFAHARKDGETFGAVLAEASALKLPLVSHRAPAMGHVETIRDGGIVCNTVEEYAAELLKLKEDKKYHKFRSENAFSNYQNYFSTEIIMNKIVSIYESVVSEKQEKIFNQISYVNHDKEYESHEALKREKQNFDRRIENNFSDLYKDDHPQGRDLDRFSHLKEAVDVGSGAGWFSSYLIEKRGFEKVYAIEPSKAAITISQKLVKPSQKINWINGYAEKEIQNLELTRPTFFNFMCILAHMPDDLAKEVCEAVNAVAPVGSVVSFSELWGEYHNDINGCWHVRPKEWWQNIFKNWTFEFYEKYQLESGRYKGLTAVKEK